jgi:hypothetical protein
VREIWILWLVAGAFWPTVSFCSFSRGEAGREQWLGASPPEPAVRRRGPARGRQAAARNVVGRRSRGCRSRMPASAPPAGEARPPTVALQLARRQRGPHLICCPRRCPRRRSMSALTTFQVAIGP